MRQRRKHYSGEEKVAILRRHLLEQVPVSDLCDELGLAPTVFYRWQKEFFEHGAAAFERKSKRQTKQESQQARKVEALEAKLTTKNEVLSELMEEHVKLKRTWGALKGRWVPHDIRDEVVDFVHYWAARTALPMALFIAWLGLRQGKFYDWKARYGKVNEHNAWIPRDFWLMDWEKQAIIDFYADNPKEGCRRLAFMMLDADVVAVSPSSVWRVLKGAGLLRPWNRSESKKGKGFHQPSKPHEHWHIDVSYINICGTFYYLCGVLDGFSRAIVHWEIRESMTEAEIEVILQRAKEKHPEATPRIISDNGPQFISGGFKEFIRISGMTHVRTSPYYPQSNGKIERWHKTLKTECIRPKTPLSLEDARRVVDEFVTEYNTVRLHSAIGYVTPKDMLYGRQAEIHANRDRKLEKARERRRKQRQLNQETAVV